MYPLIDLTIRFSFALLATYSSLFLRFTFPHQYGSQGRRGVDTDESIPHAAIFSVLSTNTLQYFILPFDSCPERVNIFSDQVVLFAFYG